MKNRFLLSLIFTFILFSSGFACTTFVLQTENGKIFFGRNFDFPAGGGHVQVNMRGQHKSSFVQPTEKPMEWISKYGSISFNQIGREFPYGGMNEAGLVIEQMWLKETIYPEPDNRFGLTELQWIQYQLDNSANVEEVIESDRLVRISQTSMATLHFLVADKAGDVAVIEYLNGKMTARRGNDLPYTVLANCPYDVSLDFVSNKSENSGKSFSGWTENSSGRFSIASKMIDLYNGHPPVDYSFSILESVAQPGATQWSIVYDITGGKIHFNTQDNNKIRKIDMNDFDFSCSNKKIFADMGAAGSNELNFVEFNANDNLRLLNEVCEKVEMLQQLPHEIRNIQAHYPLQIHCGR
jgi:penicillin V acylase-like amidase (Ntn superfamily)